MFYLLFCIYFQKDNYKILGHDFEEVKFYEF